MASLSSSQQPLIDRWLDSAQTKTQQHPYVSYSSTTNNKDDDEDSQGFFDVSFYFDEQETTETVSLSTNFIQSQETRRVCKKQESQSASAAAAATTAFVNFDRELANKAQIHPQPPPPQINTNHLRPEYPHPNQMLSQQPPFPPPPQYQSPISIYHQQIQHPPLLPNRRIPRRPDAGLFF
jgi:hypothetical protein